MQRTPLGIIPSRYRGWPGVIGTNRLAHDTDRKLPGLGQYLKRVRDSQKFGGVEMVGLAP